MEASRTPALIGHSYKDLPSSITKNLKFTAKYKNQAKTLSSHSIWLRRLKKTSIINLVKNLWHINHNSSNPNIYIKNHRNNINHNFLKICNWIGISETILEIRKTTIDQGDKDVQTLRSSEVPLEWNQNQMPSRNQKQLWPS